MDNSGGDVNDYGDDNSVNDDAEDDCASYVWALLHHPGCHTG